MQVFLAIPIFTPAINLVARFIVFLGSITGGNLGVTIILFTLFIKLLLAPLTFKSIRSSKAMQDVAPIIKDLQKKYKDDKQAFAQEQMKVYQQYGINPLAGCLPVLIQLPVFLVVYQAMRHVSGTDAATGLPVWQGSVGFLWVSDLTKIEPIADPFRILVFCAFIFQVIQTRMSLPDRVKRMQQDRQTRMQSNLITFSAALVLLFGWNFLSAMVLYWAVQAIFSAVQQYFITGWGSLSDIFPFLPVKVEKPRALKAVPLKEPGRIQKFMMQAQAAQADQQATRPGQQGDTSKAAGGTKEQRYRPDGRPMPGSTPNISANRAPTPPQRVKASDTNGNAETNGTNRPAARTKGSQQRTAGKAIGASGTPSKTPPPVPRKSKQPAPGSGGNQTGDGGST